MFVNNTQCTFKEACHQLSVTRLVTMTVNK